MNVLIFEDSAAERLEPVATGRPVWALTCAGLRLIDLLREVAAEGSAIAFHVRDYLRELAAADYLPGASLRTSEPWTLCVNGRLAPCHETARELKRWVAAGSAVHVAEKETLLAAVLPTSSLRSWDGFVSEPPGPGAVPAASTLLDVQFPVFRELHDLVRLNQACFPDNMNQRLASGNWREIADGVFCEDAEFRLPPLVAWDSSAGPILISRGCRILPFVYLRGPLFLGPENRIAEHSSIKDFVSTGPVCRLGGELESTVIEGYTNKQHHGFLGHSHLGSWINLGAGTCNSDLKNTYGTVNMRRGSERIETGMQFVGCFIGDYAKTAINTSIFTGKSIGAGSMVYGTVLSDVVPFTNHAQSLGQVTEVAPQVLIETQKRMFARRSIVHRPCDANLVNAMFERSAPLRAGLAGGPLSW